MAPRYCCITANNSRNIQTARTIHDSYTIKGHTLLLSLLSTAMIENIERLEATSDWETTDWTECKDCFKIYRLQEWLLATELTIFTAKGRPNLLRLVMNSRQHPQDRFTRATEAVRHTICTHRRAASADTVRRRLVAKRTRYRRPARGPVLTAVTDITNDYSWPHNVGISATERTSS